MPLPLPYPGAFSRGGGVSLPALGEAITLASFTNDATDNPPIFSARRDLNSGMVWTEVTAAAANEPIVGRMVRADNGAAVSSWVDLGSTDGSGTWSGYISGAPRSFNALKAQVRYRDYSDTGETANTCFVGWVLAGWGQSNFRWAGSVNFDDSSVTPIAATTGIDVRFITFDRSAGDAAGTTADLISFDVSGNNATGRQPVWAFANVLASQLDDGPIIFMAHAVSGTSPLNSVDDADANRNWSDEVLIAQAGQPHLVDQSRPVYCDLVYHNYTSSANWDTNAKALDTMPRYLLGLNPDGTAVTRGATITTGAATWDADHFFTDLYRLDTILVAQREHPVAATNAAFEHVAANATVGQYFAQTTPAFTGYLISNGSLNFATETVVDGGHASNSDYGGFTNIAEQDAAGIAFALGRYDAPLVQYDWIDWPDEEGDDLRYVHVGFTGRNVTTVRRILAEQDPPASFGSGAQPLGEVSGFVVNGARTALTTIVNFKGQDRVRIAKAGAADWTNADALDYNFVDPTNIYPTGSFEERTSLARYLDHGGVATGLSRPLLSPVQDRVASGLFTNTIPAPPGPSLVHLGSFTTGGTTTAPVSVGSVVSDGRPIIIAMGTRGTSNTENGVVDFPTAITLGGVSIAGNLEAREDRQAQKASLYYIPSPAVGTLAIEFTPERNSFENLFQVFHVADGNGVGNTSQVGSAAGPSITPALVSSAGNSLLVNMITAQTTITAVTGGEFAASVQTTGVISMGVATTVVPGVGESTTQFTVGAFANGVRLGVEILNP